MIQKGKIIDIDENGVVTIVAQSDLYLMTHREIKECYIDFIDGRKLSDKQREPENIWNCQELCRELRQDV